MSDKLIPCPSCEKNISPQAATCPGCGAKIGSPIQQVMNTAPVVVVILVSVGFIVLALIGVIVAVLRPDILGPKKVANSPNNSTSLNRKKVANILRKNRIKYNNSSAINSMRKISSAQQTFKLLRSAGSPRFGTFKELNGHGRIDGYLFKQNPLRKDGYIFKIRLFGLGGETWNVKFEAVCSPESNKEGYRTYFVSGNGDIRYGTNDFPNKNSPRIE